MTMTLVIRVLAGMPEQAFTVPVYPGTLTIARGGVGHQITVTDSLGEQRCWYASELVSLRFDGGES